MYLPRLFSISSLRLFRRNNYTFGVVSLGRLWNILYEKQPLQLCFTMLRRKAAVFLYQNLIMRCYVTTLTEIYDDPTFFGSSPGFVNWTQSDPGFVNPVRSGPGFVNPIRSDPVQVLLTPNCNIAGASQCNDCLDTRSKASSFKNKATGLQVLQ